jgi:hypothetical protein
MNRVTTHASARPDNPDALFVSRCGSMAAPLVLMHAYPSAYIYQLIMFAYVATCLCMFVLLMVSYVCLYLCTLIYVYLVAYGL